MRQSRTTIVAVAIGLALCVWMPINRWNNEREQLSALRIEEARLTTELAQRQQEFIEATSPAAIERMARQRLGMVRPGERAYVISRSPDVVDLPEVVEPGPVNEPAPIWERAAGAMLKAITAHV